LDFVDDEDVLLLGHPDQDAVHVAGGSQGLTQHDDWFDG